MKKINILVAQANEPLDENGRFIDKKVTVRHREEILVVDQHKKLI